MDKPAVSKKRKLKLYFCSGVVLRCVPREHAGSNGSKQFLVVVRTSSLKRVCELTGETLGSLRHCGCHVACDAYGFDGTAMGLPDERWKPEDVAVADETVYYRIDCPNSESGHLRGKWFVYGSKPLTREME